MSITLSRKCTAVRTVRFQLVPVDLVSAAGLVQHQREVDRTEVARLVREQRLLAAGIGALHLAELRRRVVAVDPVEENHAGVAGFPRHFHDRFEDIAGLERSDHVPVMRVHQGQIAVRPRRRA